MLVLFLLHNAMEYEGNLFFYIPLGPVSCEINGLASCLWAQLKFSGIKERAHCQCWKVTKYIYSRTALKYNFMVLVLYLLNVHFFTSHFYPTTIQREI